VVDCPQENAVPRAECNFCQRALSVEGIFRRSLESKPR